MFNIFELKIFQILERISSFNFSLRWSKTTAVDMYCNQNQDKFDKTPELCVVVRIELS